METLQCPGTEKLDPRVRRTRKLIEDAFRSLLQESAYEKISVGDVADRATVNRATFYAHFEDKRHLATTLVRGDLEAALFAHLTPGTPLNAETLGRLAEALFEFMGITLKACPKHADEFAPILMTTVQETVEAVLLRWLEFDRDAGRRFGGTGEAFANAASWSLFGGALRWSHRRHASAGRAAREVVGLLMR